VGALILALVVLPRDWARGRRRERRGERIVGSLAALGVTAVGIVLVLSAARC